jgi:hypothetical protein
MTSFLHHKDKVKNGVKGLLHWNVEDVVEGKRQLDHNLYLQKTFDGIPAQWTF